MAFDWLKDPITPEAPCGPDLERADDDGFVDYYYDAEGRLPERYLTTGQELGPDGRPGDRVFDAKSVDIKAERTRIEALLARSRDLRLLSLLARWEALAWQPAGLADALDGMAGVVAAFGDAVHPVLPDRARDRRAAIEALVHQSHLIQPLHHFPLVGAREVTWRRWQVAQGKVEPRPGEDAADANAILAALAQRSNGDRLEAIRSDLTRAARAARALHPTLLTPLVELVEGILGLIAQARPDLKTPVIDSPDDPAPSDADASQDAQPVDAPTDTLATRGEARACLSAVETYLAAREPSSAALLLVIQARRLIGKPLVEAIETLLPGQAGKALIQFDAPHGFSISMDRLRELSGEIPSPPEDDAPAPQPGVEDRRQAAAHLGTVAAYFRRTEPASPIPVLLDRAQSWLERDFESLLNEFLPQTAAQ